ncbi:LysM peptidoglycan-binding domain-containing protein [Streptomyces sp. H27-G5]|uniref:LysM peptidoglycan-binding domain-containing protein n=1 Tax=Streptomyces sp. H27-G5 TaxID=2996698 RepID=UPI0022706F4F|nr:LysM peptidoglycan-binding domain-containing protein [Streptomyces sp. H27-G5]MCY0922476.1 LysM peptidoglycan-binding domain-containing protein [Streptomyces sp. H27-G5]
MGIFDFLKSDKKKAHDAAETAKEQVEQQAAAKPATPDARNDLGGKYTDAAAATKAAADRMAAAAPPKPAPAPPRPAAAMPPKPPAPGPVAHHTPTPASAAHKAVPSAPMPKPAPVAKRMYTVKSGDSLSAIARRELGNEARWRELYALNRGVVGSNPDLIHPGMVLTLPN